jgi:ABC-2 type transport system ATP-binding protein
VTFSLTGIVVRRGEHTDLDHIDLGGEAGTLCAVVGGDGAGKSTLLRTVVGAVPPDAGRVVTPARERLGYVPAGAGVYPDLSVEENLSFAATGYGVERAARETRITELLGATDLVAARGRLAGLLSGGMRQKLAFACAMLHRPELLVMDEPTTGLDPVSRSELWRLVSLAQAEGTAVLFATTYVEEAARADHVLVLDRGRALVAGSPDEVIRRLPGQVVRLAEPTSSVPSWRRGRVRHAWIATGAAPTGARTIDPDLEDAIIVKALAARLAALPEPLR